MEYMISIIQYVLSAYKISGKRNDIYKILFSDPTFPSAVAIIRTLSYYGIRINAYKANYQQIVRKDNIMIVHCCINEGRFYIIKEILANNIVLYDGNNHRISSCDFTNKWDGIVLVIEGKQSVKHKTTRFNYKFISFILTGLVTSLIVSLLNITNAVLLFTDYIGFSLSLLLMVKDTFNYLQIPLCYYRKRFNCEAVSNSRPFLNKKNIDIPIWGCMFFLFDYLSIIYKTIGPVNITLCIVASFVALYLFLYQTFKVRKYCIFCIIIGALILVNSFIKLMNLSIVLDYSIRDYLNLSVVAVISAIIPILLYKYHLYKKLSIENELSSMRIKRFPDIFQDIQSINKTILLSNRNALIYGSGKGKYIIDTIVNLHCQHCNEIINKMIDLLHLYPELITWRVYIDEVGDSNIHNLRDNNLLALNIIEQYKKNKDKSLELLSKKIIVNNERITDEVVEQFEAIVNELKNRQIDHFPTIVFNGREFPKEYQIEDIKILINDWAQGGLST